MNNMLSLEVEKNIHFFFTFMHQTEGTFLYKSLLISSVIIQLELY